jgi:L-threonylcarbamoyladenylate synthase
MSLTLGVNPEFPDDKALVLAAEVLQSGGVVVYPTETLYGVGALALNARAVERVQALKKREARKPILVLVESCEAATALAAGVTPAAQALMEAFWPGPLTLVFSVAGRFPHALTQGKDTLGIRVPSSPLCLRLLSLCGAPVTSTSANVSNGPVLHSISEIYETFRAGVDLYLDAGVLPVRKPSSVVDVTGEIPWLLREGAVTMEELRRVVPALR